MLEQLKTEQQATHQRVDRLHEVMMRRLPRDHAIPTVTRRDASPRYRSRRATRLDVSQRRPPIACTSA